MKAYGNFGSTVVYFRLLPNSPPPQEKVTTLPIEYYGLRAFLNSLANYKL
jgi:hypothetical protein